MLNLSLIELFYCITRWSPQKTNCFFVKFQIQFCKAQADCSHLASVLAPGAPKDKPVAEEFCRDRRLRAFSKIFASSLFSFLDWDQFWEALLCSVFCVLCSAILSITQLCSATRCVARQACCRGTPRGSGEGSTSPPSSSSLSLSMRFAIGLSFLFFVHMTILKGRPPLNWSWNLKGRTIHGIVHVFGWSDEGTIFCSRK